MDKPTAAPGTRYGVPAYRETITARLTEAYANNMLDQQDFERRVEQAQVARTIEELDLVVADFGAAAVKSPDAAHRHNVVLSEQTYQLRPEQDRGFHTLAVLGQVNLDLRAFRGSGLTLLVTISGCLSETRIRVPRGTQLVRRERTILGELQTTAAGQPGVLVKLWNQLVGPKDAPPPSPYPLDGPPPTVILQGTMVLGNITIKEDAT